jgi:hypothetical protein
MLIFKCFPTENNYYFLQKELTMNERNTELQLIKDTIMLYVDGVYKADVEMLKKAFHHKAMMYGANDNNITVVEIQGLYDFVSANTALSQTGEPRQCFITSVRHAGNAASVEMVEESAYGNNYTNYFHLLKIDGKWLIVSKTYNSTPASN